MRCDSHPIDHPLIPVAVVEHAVSVAVVHPEHTRITAFAGFGAHAHDAFVGMIKAEIVDPVFNKQTISLPCGFIFQKLILEIALARSDR